MNFNLPLEVKYILNELKKNNFEGYIVGGCVRDLILNFTPLDWDITTNALPTDILNIFKKTFKTGIKHGTVTVVKNNKNFEVTTYRIDGEYGDNRHPNEVKFTTNLEEDLSRRDFTINAMAYNDECSIIDCFNGLSDLENKIIRAVGDGDLRFQEDALRMLRAIRFASRLDFKIEVRTMNAIINNKNLIKNISKERIRDEISKMLLTSIPSKAIKLLNSTGLLEIILPKLYACVGFNQNNPHHYEDVFNHTMSVLDNTEKNLVLRLSALFHDIGKPATYSMDKKGIGHFYGHEVASKKITMEILKDLRFDNKTIEQVSNLVGEHMVHYTGKESDFYIKKLINKIGIENLPNYFNLQISDRIAHVDNDTSKIEQTQKKANDIILKGEPLTLKDLMINGNDLMELGFKGKKLGEVLNYLLDEVIKNPKLNTRETLVYLSEVYLNKTFNK